MKHLPRDPFSLIVLVGSVAFIVAMWTNGVVAWIAAVVGWICVARSWRTVRGLTK